MTIRAVRNNNPGNIRIGTAWAGLMPRAQMNPDQAAETEFCVFEAPKWGFRAMAEIFHTYFLKDGIKTLRQAITRWAPPSENNTDAYVADVCGGFSPPAKPDDPFPFTSDVMMAPLLTRVSIHEVGSWAFQPQDVLDGIRLVR